MTAPAHLLFPGITLTHIALELSREAAQRAVIYARRVETARMTQAEADFQITVCHAWQGDVARLLASWFTPRTTLEPSSHDVSWADRRAALDRELEQRRSCYPGWIETARLTADAAQHQIDCLLALAAIYDDGFDWRASNGAIPAFGLRDPCADQIAARAEWDAHFRSVLQARAALTELNRST